MVTRCMTKVALKNSGNRMILSVNGAESAGLLGCTFRTKEITLSVAGKVGYRWLTDAFLSGNFPYPKKAASSKIIPSP